MKIKNIFILVVFFSILIIMNLLVFAVDSEKQASNFQSNGDLIDGWYWLRDSALQNYAEWKFENISPGTEDLVLDITALATDRPNGGSGFEAKFKLIYGFPGSGNMGGVFKTKVVTLPNVSPPNDPLGYTCQGQVTVDREFISGASTIVFRVERELAQDNHVAFKKDSIVLLTGETPPIEGGDQLPDTDELEEATLIQPGTYTGSLGEENEEGRRDNYDYYSIDLEEGQQITLQLTIPANVSYVISLLTPTTHYNRGSVTTQRGMKTLDYVADSTGTWYIKIYRSSGQGEYQLVIDVQNQNDAASGQDAGKSFQEAIALSSGTITGFLKAGDNYDYYSIDLEEGQQITLQLTIPANVSYVISLLTPTTHYNRGSVTTQGGMKTLDYVADSTGTWYIKIYRSSGQGEYQLVIDVQNQNDAASGQDAGKSFQEAIALSSGTITGFLKAGDNYDYYSIDLEEGQQITLQLTIPANVSYVISLLTPTTHYNRGSVTTQRGMKTLDYVADSTGTWYIKIYRSSGEGEYQLLVNTSGNDTEEQDNNPPVINSLNADQNSVEVNQTVTIICSASDQDIETFTFRWSVNGEIIEEESSSLSWRAPDTAGTYNITCTVSDSRGGEDSESVSITVTELSNGDNDNIGEVNYRIEITTGSRIAAGTDANVYITMYDKDGHNSGEILLDNPGVNDFERGDTNTFSVTAINIENLDYIIIRHDNSGNFPGWYVDEIQVSNEEINKEWTFLPDQWLATDEPPDNQTQGKFYPQEETVEENVEYILSLTNNGRTLTSNLPIFVKEDKVGNLEIDSDGDGIQQQWEDKAIEYINPYIELDEEEPWLQHQDSDYVANYIRVHPYDPFSTSTTFNSANLPKYIIFRYVVTWSQDYGRQSYGGVNFDIWTSHPGDHERIFMAWKVIDSNTLKLDWVFTSSHEDPDAHHAVWNASYRTCNKGDVATWPPKEYDHSEVFCGELQFNEDGRLVIYASEGKHALYPSCDICDNKVMLVDLPGPVNVGEDCGGGGRFRFDCYNVGEPPNLIDPKVHDLDPKLDTFKNDLPDILINKLKSHYRVSINTSDRDLAGTDAEIQIKLFGENNMNSQWFTVYSKSDPPRLASHVGTFERGDKDNIIVECSDLGKIIKIQIKHDNSGLGPGWHINEIWVENLETNTTWHSRPNTWLDKVLWNDNTDKTFNLE